MTKPSKHDVVDRALDLGFTVTIEQTRHLRKDRYRASVSWGNDGDDLIVGLGSTQYEAIDSISGMEDALRRAVNESGKLCVRVAEAREDFSILNRNIEGKRPIGSLSVSGEHDDDHVFARLHAGGAEAHVVHGGEMVASAGADTIQEAVRDCLRQLQKMHEAMDHLFVYAMGGRS